MRKCICDYFRRVPGHLLIERMRNSMLRRTVTCLLMALVGTLNIFLQSSSTYNSRNKLYRGIRSDDAYFNVLFMPPEIFEREFIKPYARYI